MRIVVESVEVFSVAFRVAILYIPALHVYLTDVAVVFTNLNTKLSVLS